MQVLIDRRMDAGGVGRYGRDLIDALHTLEQAPTLRVVDPARIRMLTQPFSPWGRLIVSLESARWRPHIVHGLHVETTRMGGAARVVTIHDVIPLRCPASMKHSGRRFLFSKMLHSSLVRADRIIVPSELTARDVRSLAPDPSKVRIVPMGVAPIFRPLDPSEKTWAQKRFAEGSRYAAAIAHRKPHKNLVGLIEAARLIYKHAGLPTAVVGTPTPADDGALIRCGSVSDELLRCFYGGAEVFVLPSLLEGFGLPALEALACGTPVVCGAEVGSLPYIEDVVECVDVRDPVAVAQGVSKVVASESSSLMASRSDVIADRGLTAKEMARATLRVYRELVA